MESAAGVYSKKTPASAQPPSLHEKAMRLVASLGGFLGRKGDGHPARKPFGSACSDSTISPKPIKSSPLSLTHPPCPAEDMGKDQLIQEGRRGRAGVVIGGGSSSAACKAPLSLPSFAAGLKPRPSIRL